MPPDDLEGTPFLGRIERILLERLAIRPASAEADLIESGQMDSLALAGLILALEEDLKVRLPIAQVELEDFRTLQGIAKLVERHAGHPTAP